MLRPFYAKKKKIIDSFCNLVRVEIFNRIFEFLHFTANQMNQEAVMRKFFLKKIQEKIKFLRDQNRNRVRA